MASLLNKLSYFDPETGGTFIIAGDNFLWKEGKKSPEDSKVTKLVKKYGWKLTEGNDDSLRFKKKGDDGELFVERGRKRWVYRNPSGFHFKSRGLDRLYDALETDVFNAFTSKAATPAATAVNNAGNGHDSVDGDPLPEIHIFGSQLLQARELMHDDSSALTGLRSRPDYGESDSYTSEMNEANKTAAAGDDDTEFRKMFDYLNSLGWEGRNPWYPKRYPFYAMRLYSDGWQFSLWDKKTGEGNDLASLQKFLSKFNLRKLRSDYVEPPEDAEEVSPALKSLYRDVAKRIHPDRATDAADSARRQRLMAEASYAYRKGDEARLRTLLEGYESNTSLADMGITACLVLSGKVKTAAGTEPAPLYVTAVEYEKGPSLSLASFQYSPDPTQAKVFLPRTAENLVKQIRRLGAIAKIAKPSDLLTTHNIKTQKQPKKQLLTEHNEKTQKGKTKGFLTGVMHLMPSDLAGYGNVCPCASPECRQMCLNTAGVWANAPAIQNSRRMKTELYFKNRPQFMADLRKSIQALVRKADRENLTPAVRINGTSDLPQVAMEMAKEFPQVQFYDYTKIPRAWERQLPNYHLTFSRSEINDKETMAALEHGVNVAVVFQVAKGDPMPKEWRGYKVLNGDEHDLRFLDKQSGEGPFVIGLSGKGKARGKDKGSESSFVVDPKKLVNIAPSPLLQKKEKPKEEKPKADLVQIGDKPPVSTQDTVKERTQPATEAEGLEWDELNEKSAATHQTPHNEWFTDDCFDNAHLYV